MIFPCNGNGIEALDALGSTYRLVTFVDDRPGSTSASSLSFPIQGRQAFQEHPQSRVLAVPGSPASFRQRRAIIESLGLPYERWATVVHPSASVSGRARIGRNVLIMAGAVVTSNAVIGDHVCVLPNAVIHHDVTVGDWSLVGSGVVLAGGVVVEPNAYLGSQSSVKPLVRIGAQAMVGMGATVLNDVAPGSVVAGCPARPLNA
jgi:sugar O-acyltransferase (sialic acid O-acetyltransferase NeuD family)